MFAKLLYLATKDDVSSFLPHDWQLVRPVDGGCQLLQPNSAQLCMHTNHTPAYRVVFHFVFGLTVFRTGKRTQSGLLMDGINSMVRYYKNNLSDGFRQVRLSQTFPSFFNHIPQCVWGALNFLKKFHEEFIVLLMCQDSIDLFLGNYAVDETDGPTLHAQKDWKFLTVSASHFSFVKENY